MEPTAEERSRIASYLGSLPKAKVERSCVICEAVFQGTRRARYCSRKCQMRAFRERARIKLAKFNSVEPEAKE